MKIVEIAKTVINLIDTDYFSVSSLKNPVNALETKSDFVKKIIKELGVNKYEIFYTAKHDDKKYVLTSFLDLRQVDKTQYNILFDGENIQVAINKLIADNLSKKSQALIDYQDQIIEHADNFEVIESAYKSLPKILFDFSKSSFPESMQVFGQEHSLPIPDKSILNMPIPLNYELELNGSSKIRKITLDENANFFVEIDCKIKNSVSKINTKCMIGKSVLIKILNEIEINRNSYGKYTLEHDCKGYNLVDFTLIQLELELVVL